MRERIQIVTEDKFDKLIKRAAGLAELGLGNQAHAALKEAEQICMDVIRCTPKVAHFLVASNFKEVFEGLIHVEMAN